MSGSPVYARVSGGYSNSSGDYIFSSGIETKFLGIYSSRLPRDSEVGLVWKPTIIKQLIAIARSK
jgi:hypothetical protein